MKIKAKKVTYQGKDKKEKFTTNFYLELDNGKYIAIKPSFKEGYVYLRAVAEYEE